MNLNYYKDFESDKFRLTKSDGRKLRRSFKDDYERLFKLDRRTLYKKHNVPKVKQWQVLKIP